MISIKILKYCFNRNKTLLYEFINSVVVFVVVIVS